MIQLNFSLICPACTLSNVCLHMWFLVIFILLPGSFYASWETHLSTRVVQWKGLNDLSVPKQQRNIMRKLITRFSKISNSLILIGFDFFSIHCSYLILEHNRHYLLHLCNVFLHLCCVFINPIKLLLCWISGAVDILDEHFIKLSSLVF